MSPRRNARSLPCPPPWDPVDSPAVSPASPPVTAPPLATGAPGVSFKVPILVAHQITYARPQEVPALYVDDNGYGILWNSTFLQVDPGHPFPIAGTLIRYLELQVRPRPRRPRRPRRPPTRQRQALLGRERGLAAQAVLRAIKDPARVRPAPRVPRVPRDPRVPGVPCRAPRSPFCPPPRAVLPQPLE